MISMQHRNFHPAMPNSTTHCVSRNVQDYSHDTKSNVIQDPNNVFCQPFSGPFFIFCRLINAIFIYNVIRFSILIVNELGGDKIIKLLHQEFLAMMAGFFSQQCKFHEMINIKIKLKMFGI